jgi:hypothetical protein
MTLSDAWFSGYRTVTSSALVHVLPSGLNKGDIVYSMQHPGIELKLTGHSGTTTLAATILTQDGVVINVSKEITIYDKADGLTFDGDDASMAEHFYVSGYVGSTIDVMVDLLYKENGINTGDKPLDVITPEEIKTVTWASTNPEAATVTGGQIGTITVLAGEDVPTEITVSVETVAGNVYTATLVVIVQMEGS